MSNIGAFIEANRRNWDERVPIHRRDGTGFYAVERFIAGEKRLHAIETGELGEVAGKHVIHLQCHFGLDTLILARHGAIVTGLDFSPAAIEEAKRLAAGTGLPAQFVCADVYDARHAVSGEFDIAYVTWGTICWLPDLPRWARVIASLLAPGGFLYFADAHPIEFGYLGLGHPIVCQRTDAAELGGLYVANFASNRPAALYRLRHGGIDWL